MQPQRVRTPEPVRAKLLAWPSAPPAGQLNLFSGQEEIDLGALRRDLADLAARKRADNTRRAYAADWRDFQVFCQSTGRDPLPATPETVMLYLAYQARAGKSVATITRRLPAITAEHKALGHPTPCNADVGLVLADLRRKLGRASYPKAPITVDELRAMVQAAGQGIRGLRDRALLCLGFASALRRSELSALDLAGVTSEPAGLVLRILRSKTDQEGRGREVAVHRGRRRDTCPVRNLEAWLRVRGDWPGPLFAPVTHNQVGRVRLAPAAIARVVKRAARLVGLDPRQYAGHSLRSGCASESSRAGADILAIARRLGHKSATTTERYVRHGSVFAANPLKGVL